MWANVQTSVNPEWNSEGFSTESHELLGNKEKEVSCQRVCSCTMYYPILVEEVKLHSIIERDG